MKNWKTTVAGIIVVAIGVATKMEWITVDVSAAIITIATSLGLIAAQDGKKAE